MRDEPGENHHILHGEYISYILVIQHRGFRSELIIGLPQNYLDIKPFKRLQPYTYIAFFGFPALETLQSIEKRLRLAAVFLEQRLYDTFTVGRIVEFPALYIFKGDPFAAWRIFLLQRACQVMEYYYGEVVFCGDIARGR